MALDLDILLGQAVQYGASDLHISAGAVPRLRIDGELKPIGIEEAAAEECSALAVQLLPPELLPHLTEKGEVDCAYALPGTGRFRIHAYRQRSGISISIRVIPASIPTLEQIGAPPILRTLAQKRQGLLLVTGPAGSGKSTTLAAVVNEMNRTMNLHIVTLEDPVEFVHQPGTCLIDQREVGVHTGSFTSGLRAALRQDPDVILVGELRDKETISTAITAAETGHLVLGTLHTAGSVQTVERIVDIYPPDQQNQIRSQLASILLAIVSQQLITPSAGSGRLAVREILVNNPAVGNLIRTEKSHQIRSVMQTSRAAGMQTADMHLKELASQGLLSDSEARRFAGMWNE